MINNVAVWALKPDFARLGFAIDAGSNLFGPIPIAKANTLAISGLLALLPRKASEFQSNIQTTPKTSLMVAVEATSNFFCPATILDAGLLLVGEQSNLH
jgi:hypothetical protein